MATELSNYDIIPPENFPRHHLDRPYRIVHHLFVTALGIEHTPLQASIETVRTAGRVALLDLGCGTGNTLRTLAQAVSKRAPCEPDNINATGISLHDYSDESMHPETREACTDTGLINYIVDDATKTNIPAESADTILAHMSLMHSPHPERWLDAMLQAASPNASIFFNAHPEQCDASNSPLMERIYPLEDRGYPVYQGDTLVTNKSELAEYTFFRIGPIPTNNV